MQHTESHTARVFVQTIAFAILMFILAMCFIVPASFPPAVHAQNAGVVGIQSQMSPVFSSLAAASCSAILKDIGQGENLLYYNTTAFVGTIDIEWSPTGTAPFYPVVQTTYKSPGDTFTGRQLTFGGYFPNIRSCVSGYTSGSVSAWYTSISGPIFSTPPALSSLGQTSAIQCDLSTENNAIATGTTGFIGTFTAGPINPATDVLYICGGTISFDGATVAGNVQIGFSNSSACAGPALIYYLYTTANTPQIVPFGAISSKFTGNYFGGNNYPCLTNNSGATVSVNINYASIRGL